MDEEPFVPIRPNVCTLGRFSDRHLLWEDQEISHEHLC